MIHTGAFTTTTTGTQALRARMNSLQSFRKTTRSLQLVALTKLRHSQNAALRARPMARAVARAVSTLASSAWGDHPLWAPRDQDSLLLLVIGSEVGLCGDFNSQLIRKAKDTIGENLERYKAIQLSTVGRKVHDTFQRQPQCCRHTFDGVLTNLAFESSKAIANAMIQEYLDGLADKVLLIHHTFHSPVDQHIQVEALLPIAGIPQRSRHRPVRTEFIFEPDADAVLNRIVPKHVALQVHQALLESLIAEHAARMLAMEEATRNLNTMIGKLNVKWGRVRHDKITRECSELLDPSRPMDEG